MAGTQAVRVLLVEDNPGDARLVREMLAGRQELSYCNHVVRLGDAIEQLKGGGYDATLLDLSLPDADGMEGIARLHAHYPQHPIVVITGRDNEEFALNAVHKGAQDYLVKGRYDGAQIVRALRHSIERKRLDERITYLATHDGLTGLANRTLFLERLQHAIARAERIGHRVGLLYLDLDGFKHVNDTLGHEAGDQLLIEMARRLRVKVRGYDTVARLGGDEFAILLEDVNSRRGPSVVAEKILHAIRAPVQLSQGAVHVGASIGVALYPDAGRTFDLLMQHADAAMYQVKRSNKNGYSYDMGVIDARTVSRSTPEAEFKRALMQQEFRLRYQPIVELSSGRPVGVEALLRWHHPHHGLRMPLAFLPDLEQTGMIGTVGEWVLSTVCRQISAWRRARLPLLPVAINVSPRQLQTGNFAAMLRRTLRETETDPKLLHIELTEHQSIDDVLCCQVVLNQLAELGVKIAIDDFGAGYSSFSYLKRFPIAILKIDRLFIDDITRDPISAAVTRYAINLAHELGIWVIAEGVETSDQLELLRTLGPDAIQGYLCSYPLSPLAITAMLEKNVSCFQEDTMEMAQIA